MKIFGGMGVTELRRLRQLEEENHRLKRLVADLSLDSKMLQVVIQKKVLRPVKKREVVEYLLAPNRIGVRRGCRLMIQSRAVYNYRSCRGDRALPQRIWRLQKPAFVKLCCGSKSCCGAKADWLTTRKPFGFTVWQG